MVESELIVLILSVIGSLVVFYWKIKNDIVSDEKMKSKPLEELNKSIIELNSTIKFINEMIESIKERVSNHGKEIDDIKLLNQSHEERIKTLEKNFEDKNI